MTTQEKMRKLADGYKQYTELCDAIDRAYADEHALRLERRAQLLHAAMRDFGDNFAAAEVAYKMYYVYPDVEFVVGEVHSA